MFIFMLTDVILVCAKYLGVTVIMMTIIYHFSTDPIPQFSIHHGRAVLIYAIESTAVKTFHQFV